MPSWILVKNKNARDEWPLSPVLTEISSPLGSRHVRTPICAHFTHAFWSSLNTHTFFKKCAHFLLANIYVFWSLHTSCALEHLKLHVLSPLQEEKQSRMDGCENDVTQDIQEGCVLGWLYVTNECFCLTVWAVIINHVGLLINYHKEDFNLTRSTEFDDNKSVTGICLLQ